MSHLLVELFDSVTDGEPGATRSDVTEGKRKLFYNLNREETTAFADKAARVRVSPEGEYRRGDHILLLDQVRQGNTATVAVDPDVKSDVDLNRVGFADKTAALKFILNPNPTGGFRLRVQLFDRFDQRIPNIILYDWQYPPEEGPADLNSYHFADKAAFVILQRGPNFQEGDSISLQDTVDGDNEFPIEPQGETTEVDLDTGNFANKAAALRFELT
jgi:hypothetical protein